MKKISIITAALLGAMAWTGCRNTLEQEEPAADSVVTLTIEATKSVGTKALALDTTGATDQLNASWANGEKVYVYAPGSVDPIGELTATVSPTDNTKATLSGNITATGLVKDQTLTLLFPKATWSYAGQNGRLTGEGSIASNFDFARAQVTINEVSSTQITTTKSVTFENQQSIYRFGFLFSSNTIQSQTVKLTSNRGQLVKSVNLATGAQTVYATTEPMTISPALTADEATAHALIYVALRNGNTTQDDTFSFEIYDNHGATYKGTQVIPTAKLSSPFVSAKTIPMARLELPQGSTSVATAL